METLQYASGGQGRSCRQICVAVTGSAGKAVGKTRFVFGSPGPKKSGWHGPACATRGPSWLGLASIDIRSVRFRHKTQVTEHKLVNYIVKRLKVR